MTLEQRLDQISETQKPKRFKRNIDNAGSEELHSYELGPYMIVSEINYNCNWTDRKFHYAFAVTIYRHNTELVALNDNRSYKSRHDFNIDMKRAKAIVTAMVDNPELAREIEHAAEEKIVTFY